MNKSFKIQIKNKLLLIDSFIIILILTISVLPDQVRIVLGLPLILFFPGYMQVSAMFPKKSSLDTIERVALSFVLSIAIASIIGSILSYSPWRIRFYPGIISLAGFTTIMSIIACYRQRGILEADRLDLNLNISLPRLELTGKLDRVLFAVLIPTIIGTIVIITFLPTGSWEKEDFTEFYILGAEGKAEGYPAELSLGEVGNVIIGIKNRENETMVYEVDIMIEGTLNKTIGPIRLDHQENWEKKASFVPQQISATTKIVEIVYKPTTSFPSEDTKIRVESTEQLNPGDHISIANEDTRIKAIDGDIITLNGTLTDYHAAGSELINKQKVEFKLYKVRVLGENTQKGTSLSLHLGNEALSARVVNLGQGEASYRAKVLATGKVVQEPMIEASGPVYLVPGDEWSLKMDYIASEMQTQDVEFSLYRYESKLYEEKSLGNYPELHLWIEVTES